MMPSDAIHRYHTKFHMPTMAADAARVCPQHSRRVVGVILLPMIVHHLYFQQASIELSVFGPISFTSVFDLIGISISISSSIPMAIAVGHWMAHQLLLSERDMVLTMTDKQGGALSTCSSSEIFINYVKGTSATRFGGDDHRGVA